MESINKLVTQAIPAPSNYLSNTGGQGEKRRTNVNKICNFRVTNSTMVVCEENFSISEALKRLFQHFCVTFFA